jgi:hypothetical protein
MIVNELAQRDRDTQALLPLKSPLLVQDWNVSPQSWFLPDNWFFTVDNPNWGNNVEASIFSGGRQPRLQLLSSPSLVIDPPTDPQPMVTMGEGLREVRGSSSTNSEIQPLNIASDGMEQRNQVNVSVNTPSVRKRRAKAKTLIVDDEVRRCSRFKRGAI